jgi:uncharacterized protein YicC (UPF0701 family)
MTGFGEARHQDERWSVGVEVRSVNNRHLKLSARISEPYGALEPELERLLREVVRRGTVQLSLRIERPRRAEDYRLNAVALASYRDQLRVLQGEGGGPPDLAALLTLPGVVEERRPRADDPHDDWPALAPSSPWRCGGSRSRGPRRAGPWPPSSWPRRDDRPPPGAGRRPGPGGRRRVPGPADRARPGLVQDKGVAIEPKDLIREVAILAERSDIAEEVTRLRAHLAQFVAVIGEPESAGRKLEFVVQEMGRETNTIGSKANDVEISRDVVEIKGLLEKIRELIQNVE